MARMPRPWFRRARGEWYTTMNGKQIPLGVTNPEDEAAAWAALRALVKSAVGEAVAENSPQKPAAKKGTIPALVPAFLAERRATCEPGTLRGYGQHLDWLAKHFPGTPAGLDLAELVRAAYAVATWGDTHRANVLGTCGAFLKWAGVAGEISRPPKASRGAESVIPEAVYNRLIDEARSDFRAIIRFLWHTGCRPGEATALAADSVEWESGTIRVRDHKTKKKGKTRIIYLAAEALDVLKAQRDKYEGEGLLFRGTKGHKLSLQAMTMRFQRLSEKVGCEVTSYQFRHTWATRALKAGVPAAHVAAMLGHASTAMVFKHYSHLCEEADLLRQQAQRVAAEMGRPKAG